MRIIITGQTGQIIPTIGITILRLIPLARLDIILENIINLILIHILKCLQTPLRNILIQTTLTICHICNLLLTLKKSEGNDRTSIIFSTLQNNLNQLGEVNLDFLCMLIQNCKQRTDVEILRPLKNIRIGDDRENIECNILINTSLNQLLNLLLQDKLRNLNQIIEIILNLTIRILLKFHLNCTLSFLHDIINQVRQKLHIIELSTRFDILLQILHELTISQLCINCFTSLFHFSKMAITNQQLNTLREIFNNLGIIAFL